MKSSATVDQLTIMIGDKNAKPNIAFVAQRGSSHQRHEAPLPGTFLLFPTVRICKSSEI